MDNQPVTPKQTTEATQPKTEVAPKQTTVAPTVTKPIEVAKEAIAEAGKQTANAGIKEAETETTAKLFIPKKEVRPMAKDPTGMFDYSDCKIHVVQDGENLFDIAEEYHVALQQLRYFNHINKATLRIRPNQTIYIPNKPVSVPAGE